MFKFPVAWDCQTYSRDCHIIRWFEGIFANDVHSISTKIFISIIEEGTEYRADLFRLLLRKFHLTELREVLCQWKIIS